MLRFGEYNRKKGKRILRPGWFGSVFFVHFSTEKSVKLQTIQKSDFLRFFCNSKMNFLPMEKGYDLH